MHCLELTYSLLGGRGRSVKGLLAARLGRCLIPCRLFGFLSVSGGRWWGRRRLTGVEIGACAAVGRIGVVGLLKEADTLADFFLGGWRGPTVLCAEAIDAVNGCAIADWNQVLLHIVRPAPKSGPRLAVGVRGQLIVDCCQVCRRVDVADVAAEVKEILGPVLRVPVQLLDR